MVLGHINHPLLLPPDSSTPVSTQAIQAFVANSHPAQIAQDQKAIAGLGLLFSDGGLDGSRSRNHQRCFSKANVGTGQGELEQIRLMRTQTHTVLAKELIPKRSQNHPVHRGTLLCCYCRTEAISFLLASPGEYQNGVFFFYPEKHKPRTPLGPHRARALLPN